MIWVFLWMFIKAIVDDLKWRVTDPIPWARNRADEMGKRTAYFYAALAVVWTIGNIVTFTPGDYGDVFWLMVWAIIGPTEVLVAYFAYKADHEDEDQDGDNFAWVH